MSWEVRIMRSTTSCFNATLYRKTMCRFWPLWGLYALMWLFMVPLSFLSIPPARFSKAACRRP